MDQPDLQALCEQGQEQLIAMEYLRAERTLAQAEQIAFNARDFDSLSRLYMPLQEARRQRRQRCGEGIVKLDIWAEGPDDRISAQHVLDQFPHGQLLVAGWRSLQSAIEVRRLAAERELYVDTFLAAAYPAAHPNDSTRMIAIEPMPNAVMPPANLALMQIRGRLSPRGILLAESDLLRGPRRGTAQTYGMVMDLWERLHGPFLEAADALTNPLEKVQAYRKVIEMDYACELAHQKLADTARRLSVSRKEMS